MIISILLIVIKTIVCSTNWSLGYYDEFDRDQLNSGNIIWKQIKAVSVCRSKFR